MKKITLYFLTAVLAASFAACGGAADNKSTSTAPTNNTPPTKEELFAQDKQAYQAWIGHDTKFFEYFLSDNFVGFQNGQRLDKPAMVKAAATHKCEIKTFQLDDARMQMAGPDVAVLTYKATFDGTCDGKKLPDTRAASVFVRRFDEWKGAYHSETPITATAGDKKTEAKTEDKKAEGPQKEVAKTQKAAPVKPEMADAQKSDAAKAEDKKAEDAKNAEAKKAEDAKTAEAKKAGDANNAEAKPPAATMKSADPVLMEEFLAVEKAGWQAWKDKDAKKLDEVTTKDITLLDASGNLTADKAETLKFWAVPCTVSSVDVTDPYSTSLTTDVGILTYKGNAVGTCGSQKLGPVWGATVFLRDAGNWKATFIVEIPAS